MIENKDIVEVYKKRIYNELLIAKREKIAKAKAEDEFVKLAQEYNANVNQLLESQKRINEMGEYDVLEIPTSLSVTEKIDVIEKEFKDGMDARDRIVEEVRALEKICENADSLTKLYKKFGILDKDGKIYDYMNK